jgi:hypothetical protein
MPGNTSSITQMDKSIANMSTATALHSRLPPLFEACVRQIEEATDAGI